MKKIFTFLLLIQLFTPGFLVASEKPLQWPIKIGISQSSSFAEFRGLRFHAGIDLRTQRRCGVPVYAIADGYISRASIQFRGYGYGLYIDHPSLKTRVVYGHLEDFAEPLKSYCGKKLSKMGKRHGINEFFKPWKFPVKKGQIVAFSGESGSGPPHLHFETRTLNDEPIAPAILGYRPADKILPTYHNLYFEPIQMGSKVENSFNSYFVKLKKIGKTKYVWNKTIDIIGKARIKVGVMDSNGAGNFYGIEKIELFLNEKKLFERLFHKYSYSENNQCPFVYDYFKSNMRGTGYVINLFKGNLETLSFSKGYSTKDGILNAETPGIYDLKILATDFGGNQISAAGKISFTKQLEANASSLPISENDLKLGNVHSVAHTESGVLVKGKILSISPDLKERATICCLDLDKKSVILPFLKIGNEAEILIPYNKDYVTGLSFGNKTLFNGWNYGDIEKFDLNLNDSFYAKFSKKSLTGPGFYKLLKTIKKPLPGGSKKKGFLPPFSDVFAVLPKEKVFFKPIKIGLKPENYKGNNLKKLGIYTVAKNGSYSHMGEEIIDGVLWASTRTSGEFVVLEDAVAPKVWYSSQQTLKHLGACWVYKATDLGEGVNYLGSQATYNNVACEIYADPDKASVYVVKPLRRKKNGTLVLKVFDYAGNVKIVKRKF